MDGTRQNEDGFVLVAIVATLIPMLLMVATFGSAMTGRTDELMTELDQERALLAAEAGIDDAIYRGQTGALVDGDSYERDLAGDLSFAVETTYLMTDGADNDGDTLVDEADEDVYQVVITGRYRDTRRRLAAYLGPVPLLPTIASAVVQTNPGITIEIGGSAQISGHDTNLDGTLSGASQAGMSIASPGTVADLAAELNGGEENRVIGTGANPSLAVAAPIDLPTVVASLQNIADNVLTSDHYTGGSFGTPGAPQTSYRNGDVRFNGNSDGAGVLVVTGDLEINGNFRFDGTIIVLGDVSFGSGSAEVFGGLIQGSGSLELGASGSLQLNFSAEGVAVANAASGRYVAFNGWQELAR